MIGRENYLQWIFSKVWSISCSFRVDLLLLSLLNFQLNSCVRSLFYTLIGVILWICDTIRCFACRRSRNWTWIFHAFIRFTLFIACPCQYYSPFLFYFPNLLSLLLLKLRELIIKLCPFIYQLEWMIVQFNQWKEATAQVYIVLWNWDFCVDQRCANNVHVSSIIK